MASVAIGVFLAVLAAICNGTFTIFSKMEAVRRARVDPLIFNFWACIGIAVTSFLALIFVHKLVFTPLGLLSGLFFVVSAANAYRAVRLIGVSVGTGIWCGTAVVVSFLAGLIFDPHGHVRSLALAIIGMLILLAGICSLAAAGHMGRVATGREDELDTLLYRPSGEDRISDNFTHGVIAAVLAGILGGLVMLPMTRAKHAARGLTYLPSFAIGVLIFAPIVTVIPYLSATSRTWPPLNPKVASGPGLVSGLIWNIGNALSILSILYVGYTVAYPIMQCGIFVAGLWGMFLFGEISGNAASLFWGSGAMVLIGIVLLALAK
ncbi:uncharacterized protein LOC112347631 [Selaginella moellendorffii]|uniref:uncharacterized protein LOC112347631 n=1 Tax=Selaginella moellendorffii TaxID=88036 RepID=UPI000D1C48A2|nr:uncharacterized protein LOC112347631 [Selaginella moellendorffii]|eukprot:XP_024534560.1 uncharacterized protein LOC112347631 [Selaginella moellendorffii]